MNIKEHFWEVDLVRGLATVMMVVYHFLYDLNFFDVYRLNIGYGFWWFFARSIATLFIVLVGVSITLSYSRTKVQNPQGNIFPKYLKQGLSIFMVGVGITIATWFLLKEGFILFGILHFIGVSIILAYPFIRYRFFNLLLGAFLISIGVYLKNLTFDFSWLFWLGFRPENFYTLDYFPVLPWLGVVLIGLFLGNVLYPNYNRMYDLWDNPHSSLVKLLCTIGRRSLLIYLVHQPILIILLQIFGIVNLSFYILVSPSLFFL